MFDQLQDPNPPTATSGHLAVVAERAAGMRRRRAAATSSLAVLGLVGAGAVALAVTGADDEPAVEFAGEPLPAPSTPATDPAPADPVATTTTVLDPASLPPAVPVNPDPGDLPPATSGDSGSGSGDDSRPDGATGDGGSTGGSAEQPNTDDSGSIDDGEGSDGDIADPPAPDTAASAALRAADPVVAVTSSGAAVWFPDLDDDPLTLGSTGDIVRSDFLGDGTATIERNGSGVLSTFAPDGSPGDPITVGTAHEVGPDGATVCGLDGGAPAVVCVADGQTTTVPLDRPDVTLTDLTWFDGDTVLAIGTLGEGWTISIVELATDDATTRGFAGQSFFDDLRFAGRDASGRIAVHHTGTDTLLLGTLDRYGGWDPDQDGTTGSSLEVRTFDGPMRSIWLDGATELVVEADGTLSVDGVDVAGSYRSARI